MLDVKKKRLFQKQAKVAKALSHMSRIAVVDFLKDGPQCVCDIADHVNSERSNVSKHLSVLVEVGILDYHKEGLKVIYELKVPCVLNFFSCLSEVLKQKIVDEQQILKQL